MKPHREGDRPYRESVRKPYVAAEKSVAEPEKTYSDVKRPREVIDPEFRRAKIEYKEQQKERAEKEAARKLWKTKGRYEKKSTSPERPHGDVATPQEGSSYAKKSGFRSERPYGRKPFAKPFGSADRAPRSTGYAKKREFDPKNTTVYENLKAPQKTSEKKSYESYSKGNYRAKDKR